MRTLFIRAIVSILVYGTFVVLATAQVLTAREDLRYAMLVPLVAAVFILPRKVTRASDVPEDSEEGRTLARIGLWFSYVRVIYLLVAIFILVGLPAIVS